jgi:hypothetical protein
MAMDRNKIYLILAFILWIIAYISSFAIKGGTPIGPLLYILGSVFFLLTQRPQDAATSQVQSVAEEDDERPAEEDELDG